MKLGRRLLMVYLGSVAALWLVFWWVAATEIRRGVAALEREVLARNLQRVQTVLAMQAERIERFTADWAYWDDTYAFVRDRNQRYIVSNMTPDTFQTLDVDFMLILGGRGEAVWTGRYVEGTRKVAPALDILQTPAIRALNVLAHEPRRTVKGLALVRGRLCLVAACPVLRSDRTGTPRGVFVIGRFVDSKLADEIGLATASAVELRPLAAPAANAEERAARRELAGGKGSFLSMTSRDRATAYAYVHDPSGDPVGLVVVATQRELPAYARRLETLLGLGSMLAAAVIGWVVALWLRKNVVKRLKHLAEQVESVELGAQTTARVDVTGADELTNLAARINDMLARIEAEHQTAEEHRMRFEGLFQSMPEGCAIHEMLYDEHGRPSDYRFLAVNPSFCRTLGVPKEQVVGRTVREVFPGIEGFWIERYGRVVETGEPAVFEDRSELLGKDFEVVAFPLGGARFAVIFMDVTDRKEAVRKLEQSEAQIRGLLAETQEARNALMSMLEDQTRTLEDLERSQAQYQSFIDATPDLVFLKDAEFRYVVVNEANARFFGLPEEEILGKTDFDLMPPEAAARCRETDEAALQAGYVVRHTEQVGDRVYETRKFPIRFAEGVGVGGVITDITEHVRAQQVAEARLRLLERAATSGVEDVLRLAAAEVQRITGSRAGFFCTFGPDGRSVAERAWSSSPDMSDEGLEGLLDSLVQRPQWETAVREGRAVLHDEPAPASEGRQSGAGVGRLLFLPVSEGSQVRAMMVLVGKTVPYHEGDVGTAQDLANLAWEISERKRAEEQARQMQERLQNADKLEMIGRLAASIAHDFNNILTIISGSCEELEESFPTDSVVRRYTGRIHQAARRGSDLTHRFLAFSRRQPLRIEVFDVSELVAETEELLRPLIREDIRLVLACSTEPVRVRADRTELERAIMNLAANARDAMPQGGELVIETASVYLDDTYVATHPYVQPGRYVMLAVSDTGAGMDAETRRHAFEPFFTTKPEGEGTGLGLASVYGTVKQLGGSVEIYSELGKGTTVKIYLPQTEEAATPRPPSKVRVVRGSGETILLVEDEAGLRQMAVEMLQRLGYEPVACGSAEEAIEQVRTAACDPALVLTDVVMPGMNGAEMARRMWEIRPDLKVLFMSGYTDNAIVHNGMLDPGVPFLRKPFTRAELARAMALLLRPEVLAEEGEAEAAPEADVPEPTVQAEQPAEEQGKKRILVVDDEEALAEITARALKRGGYEAVMALNLDQTLEALGASSFRAMLLDVRMWPHDAKEILRVVRERGFEVPAILNTGNAYGVNLEEYEGLGVIGIQEKSARLQDIVTQMETILSRSEQEQG